MPAVVNDVIRAAAVGEFDFTEDIINVFWFKITTLNAGDDDSILVDLDGYLEDFYTAMAGSISNKLLMDRSSVINKTQDVFIGEKAFTFSFNGVGEVLPPQIAALIIGRTAKPRTQGRKYVGPLTEGAQVDGIVTAAVKAELDDAATKYVGPYTGVSTNVYDPGVAKLDPATGELLGFEAFKQGKALGPLRTQRRRTLGRGS